MKKLIFTIAITGTAGLLFAGMSYTVNYTHAIVTDNTTGLVWTRCSIDTAKGLITERECSEINREDTFTWTAAIDACNGLKYRRYRGYSNWRLPSAKELQSISDYKYQKKPSINTSAFPNTQYADLDFYVQYWTSTTSYNDTNNAWSVNFNNGTVGQFKKSYAMYVRCVAGPSK